MTVRVGINGFGRIGRNFFRAAKQRGADIEFVAANEPFQSITLAAHLMKYDTILGTWDADIAALDDGIKVNGETLSIITERDPKALPWGELGVDVVVESTGVFSAREQAAMHLDAGAPLVIVSDPAQHKVVSNASCTTNCFVPMVKVLDDAFGVERGLMTTVHAYTATQAIVDGPSKDLREARAAALNIIPSSTGAARATSLVLEAMKGRLDGQSLRVPVADGSITDFTAVLGREVTKDEVNDAFRAAAESGPMSKVLVYSEAPIVSSDIVGTPASCTFDAPLTMTMGSLVKVMGWYDNEWGYSNRLVDLVEIVGAKLK
jgi:glyceraldehyde 3-phosphate dehydrogenase